VAEDASSSSEEEEVEDGGDARNGAADGRAIGRGRRPLEVAPLLPRHVIEGIPRPLPGDGGGVRVVAEVNAAAKLAPDRRRSSSAAAPSSSGATARDDEEEEGAGVRMVVGMAAIGARLLPPRFCWHRRRVGGGHTMKKRGNDE
jgi:hypothetical protein